MPATAATEPLTVTVPAAFAKTSALEAVCVPLPSVPDDVAQATRIAAHVPEPPPPTAGAQ